MWCVNMMAGTNGLLLRGCCQKASWELMVELMTGTEEAGTGNGK